MGYHQVDIIIPIYNAYEDLKLCVESVKTYTDLSRHRLILIDDCSSDARIRPFLKQQEEAGALVIENERNKGFSENVNTGIACSSDHDVLLLNSDTVVTRGWLEKIIACAYDSEEIGTVTPMSNAATLCSVPEMCVDNPIPEGLTIAEFGELIERCSLKRYPRISVAVGFCMFIKRAVLDEVGLFDAKTFGRGYGEENDFCNRAEQLGYIHVMCDDTFVYHKGTGSFQSKERQQLIAEHDRILEERYPGQIKKNGCYCAKNPDQYLRDNIRLYLNLKNGKKNILYLIHSDFREDAPNHVGGTQFHLKDLAQGLKESCNVFVLARVKRQLQLTIYQGARQQTFRFEIGEKPLHPLYRSRRAYELYRNILIAFEINLVHIQHLSGLTFDLAYAAKDLGLPLYLTLHDFYYICTNEKLMDENDRFCEEAVKNRDCRPCLRGQDVYEADAYQEKWEHHCLELLKLCDRLITPSDSARQLYVTYYPQLCDKIQVISHGADLKSEVLTIAQEDIIQTKQVCGMWEWVFDEAHTDPLRGWAFLEHVDASKVAMYLEVKDRRGKVEYYRVSREEREDVAQVFGSRLYSASGFRACFLRSDFARGTLCLRIILKYDGKYYAGDQVYKYKNQEKARNAKNLNVAFVGGLSPAKGSHLACELIRANQSGINWFIFGNTGDPELDLLVQDNLYKSGGYEREELPGLLKKYQIDLVCILSVWPETFCYTVSEALLCKVPVLASDLGAIGERVKASGCGIFVDVRQGVQAIQEPLNELLHHRELLTVFQEHMQAYHEKTVAEMCQEYLRFYEKEAVQNQGASFDAAGIYHAWIKE